jgi:glycosyltransferase involved in cell wall biosynthesis
MKVAIVNQPMEEFTPPACSTSIALWNYEMSRVLSEFCNVVVYARTQEGWPRVGHYGAVECRRLSILPDGPIRKLLNWTSWMRNRRRSGIASSLYHIAYAYQLAHDLQHQECDVVHVANYSQFVPIIRRLNPKIHIVLHMHCNWLTQIDADILRSRLRHADLILGCSQHITRRIKERFPDLADHCDTIYNGVSQSFFGRDLPPKQAARGKGRKLVFVGRVSPEKGVHVLIEAFRTVAARHPDASLDIIGHTHPMPQAFYCDLADDEERAALLPFYRDDYFQRVKQLLPLEVTNRVRFVGTVDHQSIHKVYQNADICLIPSICEEAFGMPAAEAMAAGVPVIGARTGGIPEIIDDGHTGFLVPKYDSDALAAAMCRLLENDEMRLSMGRAGRERCAAQFTWDKLGQAMFEKYEGMCGAGLRIDFSSAAPAVPPPLGPSRGGPIKIPGAKGDYTKRAS